MRGFIACIETRCLLNCSPHAVNLIEKMLASNSRRSISVFFPAFNDAQTIPGLVRLTLKLLSGIADDYEVLVINDGSTDKTGAIIDELARAFPRVRAIHHASNQGYGAALQTGFSQATKDLVFYTDGDGQYDVNELMRLLPLMTDGVDVVNGYKAKRADGRHRIMLGAVYNWIVRGFFNLPISDVDCDFRLIRQRFAKRLGNISKSGAACVELVRELQSSGAVFAEVEVNHYPRAYGQSQFFTFRNVARTLFDLGIFSIRVCLARLRSQRNGSEHLETDEPSNAVQPLLR
jgi:glycosyltransferase involved in cell wall biosynthesis